jgi:L-cysteine/cystine lyase
MLWVHPGLRERLGVSRRGYGNLADPNAGLAAAVHPDGRCFDAPSLSAETLACALGALEVLESAGWAEVYERARRLCSRLAGMLAEHGREVAPRGNTTLVSFHSPDPEGERAQLAQAGVVLRNIPGRPWLRASVGAWNDEGDLERLVSGLAR